MNILYLYLIVINIFGGIITISDKYAAVRRRQRVSERTLLLLAFVGGAPIMYITMLIIRHKTRKPMFMIGIPVIFVLELLVCYPVFCYVIKII